MRGLAFGKKNIVRGAYHLIMEDDHATAHVFDLRAMVHFTEGAPTPSDQFCDVCVCSSCVCVFWFVCALRCVLCFLPTMK